jgi:hypothetical protein
MNSKTIAIGIIVLAALVVFTAPAMAGPNTMYFTNYSGDTSPGGTSYVEVWLHLTDPTGDVDPNYGYKAADINITIDPYVGDITAGTKIAGYPDPWTLYWSCDPDLHDGVWMNIEADVSPPPPIGMDPGVYPVVNLTIVANNPGVMDLHFSHDAPRWCDLFDSGGNPFPSQIWTDGTFTCGDAQTFTKDLPAGWNLISLPLTPTDNSVSTVLSGVSQNAVKQYNAVTKQFEDAAAMDPGTGYFVHVMAASIMSYTGTPESSTSTELKSGLNMIGVPNCAIDVGTAMGSTDYRYVARWNATAQKFEVYNPNAPPAFHRSSRCTIRTHHLHSTTSQRWKPVRDTSYLPRLTIH